jgi:hypothetical protein
MSRPKTTSSTTGAYQPEHPALPRLEKRLPIGRLIYAEFVADPMFKSVLTRHGGLMAGNVGIFYIGLGDQFDDDRRLVRETPSAPRPTRPA